ncbi:MAG: DsbC family protein [gamma proteobacterium symbiont of Bathyaustriella thionipta]|nr:DsbC family protein [gamma proteobacterium symbiont of Bathyaustriella thionipta]MCU7950818.1 DsbC family protein [gamma proteobacterium symbiont of Bathyaustriella thionipta]MCU7952397.1 DsbC family protein [gamma proteobacterium symbiont of Bathyaustriella thionipta]MCU7957332.1 DsbC family protein [gamma proteobacterium symbiont of Bathyaustriella thionipta]MCU7968422.1 DsbC family protein [gamma proteobacterium symbiont of Bathyaustriella thionipta]
MAFNNIKNKIIKSSKQARKQNVSLRSLSMGMAAVIAVSTTLLSMNAIAKSTPELDAALDKLMPGTKPGSIEETALPGLYEVSYGSTIFYFNKDASLMFRGDIIDVEKRVNLTENKRGEARGKLLKSMDESQMIVYPAKNEKAKVTVFTDIDCPYCVKLHREMADYNAEGITIRYMAYPRSGIGTRSYQKAVSVWCSDDPAKAMGDAKEGQAIPNKTCENPVAQQFQLGQALGVQGTPAMFLEDGTSLPGYVPAKRLSATINGK